MGGAAAGGIGMFCRSVGQACAKQRGKLSQTVVLPDLQGKRIVRQRSLNKKSLLLLLVQQTAKPS
jgi:hypothetical protein